MFSQVKVTLCNLEILSISGTFLLKKSQQKNPQNPNTQIKTPAPVNQLMKQRFCICGNILVIRNGKTQTCEIREVCIQNRNSLALMTLFRLPFYTCSNTRTSNFGENLCRVMDLLIHQRIILVLCQCNVVLQKTQYLSFKCNQAVTYPHEINGIKNSCGCENLFSLDMKISVKEHRWQPIFKYPSLSLFILKPRARQ